MIFTPKCSQLFPLSENVKTQIFEEESGDKGETSN